MPVPPDNMLCRFVSGDKNKWSTQNSRPRPPAFKENGGLSVWHLLSLQERGVPMENLLIGTLQGHGQAHHTAGDYVLKAQEAEKIKSAPISIVVEWRPEEEYVKEDWRQWAYAHVQVEYGAEQEAVCVFFRQLLSKSARKIVPPAPF